MRYPEKLLSALRAIDKALPNEYTPMYILLLGYHVWCDLLDQKDLDIPNLSQTTNILPTQTSTASARVTTPRKYEAAFGQSTAEEDRQNTTIENHLLATHAMNEISLDMHNAYDKTRKAARQNIDRSLHHAALEYLMLNNDAPRYEDLVEQLGRIDRGEKLEEDEKPLVKAGIKSIYEDFLEDFQYLGYTGKTFHSCMCICSARSLQCILAMNILANPQESTRNIFPRRRRHR
ncbi:hypothetical protein N5P37_006920 [Trichoderma harzianum]|uniref:Uncharacterized protein n=1 Tax=Trichoderma harzianum CBS 226.95 TaxID=983964 RepID=A0A2T4A2C9_TRIHA|nr:hypothetical protein M431DRAFT_540127 [Trichoderma harzianum CBS 226.95]KAK0760722.1 hypothetical protein N5P37_006920 [Trichoderma harzianum]PTB51222.1 hypothetical protein M431DRAFT_540127 [Trichoderma harzianum CBS 226.95]